MYRPSGLPHGGAGTTFINGVHDVPPEFSGRSNYLRSQPFLMTLSNFAISLVPGQEPNI